MITDHPFARIEAAVPVHPDYRFSRPVCWEIARGESWAVVGPNGAGKSLLSGILTRRVALKSGCVTVFHPRGTDAIRTVSFHDIHPPAECRNMYYQQRWNATETDETPLVEQWFGPRLPPDRDDLFGIARLFGRRTISLSSGELRKLLIARSLRDEPELLIIDNPFIGLDASSRQALEGMLCTLSRNRAQQCVLVVSDPRDIPQWVDRVLPVGEKTLFPPMDRRDFEADTALQRRLFGVLPQDPAPVFRLPETGTGEKQPDFSVAVRMNGVRVTCQGHAILRGIDWTVRRGERWAVLGANGSGKSTLLSLICGDNPQAYANDIVLFDRRRGTGESIWDIKRRIGYLSPEMHSYYLEPIASVRVVASGFFDSVGLYRRCSETQMERAGEWLRVLGAQDLAEKLFTQLSYGQQRLVLLARALVKDPDLLILDEPFHGLDAGCKRRAKAVVEQMVRQRDKTLLFVSHYRDEIPDCVDHELTLPSPTR